LTITIALSCPVAEPWKSWELKMNSLVTRMPKAKNWAKTESQIQTVRSKKEGIVPSVPVQAAEAADHDLTEAEIAVDSVAEAAAAAVDAAVAADAAAAAVVAVAAADVAAAAIVDRSPILIA
jgi:hypothetical protein